MSVKVGDEVILPPYHQGQEVKIAGKKYTLLRESEILMNIKKLKQNMEETNNEVY